MDAPSSTIDPLEAALARRNFERNSRRFAEDLKSSPAYALLRKKYPQYTRPPFNSDDVADFAWWDLCREKHIDDHHFTDVLRGAPSNKKYAQQTAQKLGVDVTDLFPREIYPWLYVSENALHVALAKARAEFEYWRNIPKHSGTVFVEECDDEESEVYRSELEASDRKDLQFNQHQATITWARAYEKYLATHNDPSSEEDYVKACVPFSAAYDMTDEQIREDCEDLMGSDIILMFTGAEENFEDASPVYHLKDVPTLIFHGKNDGYIYCQSVDAFADILDDNEITYSYIFYEDSGHGGYFLSSNTHYDEVITKIDNWFGEYLRD